MSNAINATPYLRTSRSFPQDPHALAVELSKAYIDIANRVNDRSIGLFATTRPVVTGDSYFLTNNQRQQSFRQVYSFTAAGNIPHNVRTDQIFSFGKAYGWFTDGNNWYGAIYGSNVAIAGQVSFYLTPFVPPTTPGNIVVLAGAGAPAIVSGIIVLEWLSNP